MRRHRLLALLLAGCAGAPPAPPERAAAGPAEDLVAIARAMSEIDAADQGGAAAGERQKRTAAAMASPDDPVARFLALYALPRDEEAWGAFRELAVGNPRSPWGSIGMARVYLAWNVLDQLDAEVARAREVAPGNWIPLLLRAQAAERRGRAEEAAADYRAVLAADPGQPDAHLGMARLARKAGDATAARSEASAVLASSPDHPGALVLLGTLALDQGDRKLAAQLFDRAAAHSPGDYEARVRLARLQTELGYHKGAAEQWRAALAIKEDPPGLKAMAEAARRGGEPGLESWAVERLALAEPAVVDHWRRLGELRVAAGDRAGAETALRRVLERAPGDAAAHLELAVILEGRGDLVAAVEHVRAAGDLGRSRRALLEGRLGIQRVARRDVRSLERAVSALVDRVYRQRVRERPRLGGTLALRVLVDRAGSATQVEVVEDSVRDPTLRACAYWNLRDAAYPQKKPGRYAFRFSFRPPR